MRMSCNGCRVLRKGCSENCSIRPCLQWIKSPDSQANATVFLAKFYGRAGLLNLINAGPEHIRPAIFRSLLYEACGRIVNPIYGSVGLLWSGSWQLCQNAVEAVLKGAPITQIASEMAEDNRGPPLQSYDIRHVSKDGNQTGYENLHKVKSRSRFKRTGTKSKETNKIAFDDRVGSGDEEINRSMSHESSVSHPTETTGESRETESMVSEETAEADLLLRAEMELVTEPSCRADDGEVVDLELTLGFEPRTSSDKRRDEQEGKRSVVSGSSDEEGDDSCRMELGLGSNCT
ncbi:Lateral organ boundaries, LOB [Dillenia turbinata]|uniref:Lateral organ boundaries, LOB n=1 Tax=Dillenia turbinata TaxID=194707 RepID=A0AAN8YUF7_9MAGN